jgi:uncharacterized protein (TIGR03437 family)
MRFTPLRIRFLVVATALIVLVPSAVARPAVHAALNGASYERYLSPGTTMSIFGVELATSTAVAETIPLPRSLAGVTVTLDGVEAPLYYVSANQINAQIPYTVGPGRVSLAVTTPAGQSSTFRLDLVSAAPGVFSRDASGTGSPLLLSHDFEIRNTVLPGERIILYATGLGATDPPIIGGDGGASTEPLNRVVNVPDVYIGGQPAVVEFAGVAPGFAGVYQLNVVAPDQFSSNELLVIASGHLSQAMTKPAVVPSEIAGSAAQAVDNREIGEFRRVQLLAVADVDIQVGSATSLTLSGDDNVLPLITTGVDNGALKISTKRRYRLDNRTIRIQVATPSLERVTVVGVGGITVNGLRGERFGATFRGVGNVVGSGEVDSVDALLEGVGNISLFGLTARVARIWCAGVGRVDVTATDLLFARVFGLGSVIYAGDPEQTDVVVEGLGSVRPQ